MTPAKFLFEFLLLFAGVFRSRSTYGFTSYTAPAGSL